MYFLSPLMSPSRFTARDTHCRLCVRADAVEMRSGVRTMRVGKLGSSLWRLVMLLDLVGGRPSIGGGTSDDLELTDRGSR